MREESNRMITNMELNRQAEKEQRDKNLQAIKENNAYTERIEKQNFDTQIQNLQAEKNAEISGIQLEAAEAKVQQAQTQSTLSIISTLSQTAGKAYEALDAEMLKQDTAKANAAFLVTSKEFYTPEQQQRSEEAELGRSSLAKGTVDYTSRVTELDTLTGAAPYQTARSIASSHGLTGRSLQIYNNLVAYKAYSTNYQKNLLDGNTQYTASDGRQFTGAEAANDPYLAGELQRLTLVDVMAKMGITEPTSLAQAHERILKFNEAAQSQASANALEQAVEIGMEKASQLLGGDSYDDAAMAYTIVKHLPGQGHVAALDFVTDGVANPNTSPEMREHLGNLVINGKKFSEGWAKNRWLPALEKAETAIVKMETADRKLQQDAINNEVFNNIDEVTAFIDEDPYVNGRAVEERFTDQGFPVPAYITKHVSNAIKKNDEVIKTSIEQKFQDNIIDDAYINQLPTVALRKYAQELKTTQDDRKYGENYSGLKKNLIGDARQLTSINPGGANTSQTFLVYGKAVKEYQGFIDQGFAPVEAAGKVNELIQEARAGAADDSNPFYFVSGANNRRTFPNIETSAVQRTERSNLVDKKLLTYGAGVFKEPFLTATSSEMDATYQSSLEGNTVYPPLILSTAAKLGLKPSEAYNAVRKAQNSVTGENKPLLNANDSVVKTIDAADVRARALITSGNPMQIRRGAVSLGVGDLPLRSNSFNSSAIPAGYGTIIDQAAKSNNIPPSILAGLIDTESAFNPGAVSPVGARGLGQFMPPTAAEFGVDVNDPVSSIDGAARYLRYLINYFDGDMNKAIYAYNGGMGNIERYGGPIPGNVENQEYLTKVLNNARKYR